MGNGKIDFGRAVSRILSAPLRVERTICLCSQYPGPVSHCESRSGQLQGPLFGLAPDGVFRASTLTRGAVGSYPAFSPLPSQIQTFAQTWRGGLFSVALSVEEASRPPLPSLPGHRLSPMTGYAASRPAVFGLSSPGLRRKRFSALPKPEKY